MRVGSGRGERIVRADAADAPHGDLPAIMHRARARMRGRGLRVLAALLGMSVSGAALAQAAPASILSLDSIHNSQGVAGLSIFLGLVLLATVTALLHLTGRKRWTQREAALTSELMDARARLDRANVFLAAEPQILVAWGSSDGEPEITGDLSIVTDAPVPRRVLGFGSWLAPAVAQQLDHAVERLRARGEAFRMALVSMAGRHIEVEGRAVGGRAIMRIRDVSGDRLELSRLRERHARMLAEADALRAMLDALPCPVWMRDAQGDLSWVNLAYARALEARDPQVVVDQRLELLDQSVRQAAAAGRAEQQIWRARLPLVIAGERRFFEVHDVPSRGGSVGIGLDVSEVETLRADLARQLDSHARTLDQLATGVAIFDRAKRLVFHNAAYRQLWSIDAAFLDQRPSDGEILDHLRAAGRLPEQADYRGWRNGLMAAYQSVETSEQGWFLPDGRTMRVVTSPNPQGGVTYLFDDVSERFHLESQYNALIRVQGETLDSLKEGVAVFGTDGRLKLCNPALVKVWKLDETMLAGHPHIDELARLGAPLTQDAGFWPEIRSLVTGLHDMRTGFAQRITLRDGSIIDCAAAPLPDGATLLTFSDVTAGANVERALTERNDALTAAGRVRNDFVHLLSYELRSPLTNIIGFVELLGESSTGPLNPRQREYAGHILKSSAALLTIINEILDLATIDQEQMKLDLGEVDIREAIAAAANGVQDRLAEASLRLRTVVMDDIGAFVADGKRLRQILFNLLSNAISFSSAGQTISLAALRRGHEIVFKVSDQGRGIPADVLERVLERKETFSVGARHRGSGLGLSIVRAFVEQHGGRILIDSAPGEGTTVTCIFPAAQDARLAPPIAQERTAQDGAL